jgi:hypothetical protein
MKLGKPQMAGEQFGWQATFSGFSTAPPNPFSRLRNFLAFSGNAR